MKRLSLLLVVLFVAMFSAPSPVNAENGIFIERTRIVGASAYAEFTYEEAGVVTFVNVMVNDSTLLAPPQPNGPKPWRFANVSVFRVDTVRGVPFGVDATSEDNFQLTVSRDLTAARLVGTLLGFDLDGWAFDVPVDLTWEASGELGDDNFHNLYHERGYLYQSHTNGAFRDGIATGTIYARGENFAPVPSTSAQVQDTKSGSLMVQIVKE